MNGPFQTERQALDLPGVRAIYEAFGADPGAGKMAPYIRAMIADALTEADIELGAWDQSVVTWLSRWEPQVVAVIASWVTRAAGPRCHRCGTAKPDDGSDWCRECEDTDAAGALAALRAVTDRTGPAAVLAEVRAVLERFDWEYDDRQYALEAIERIVMAAPEDKENLS